MLLLALLQAALITRTRESGLQSRGDDHCCNQIPGAAGSHSDVHLPVQHRPGYHATSLLHSRHASAAAQFLAAAGMTWTRPTGMPPVLEPTCWGCCWRLPRLTPGHPPSDWMQRRECRSVPGSTAAASCALAASPPAGGVPTAAVRWHVAGM